MDAQIESALSQEAVFKQLEEYQWEKDREFQGGLSAILGPSPSPSQLRELTLRAQCFYFSRKKNIPINFDAYKSYLAEKNSQSQDTQSALSNSANTSSQVPSQRQHQSSQDSPQRTPLATRTDGSKMATSSPLPWQISASPQPSSSTSSQNPPISTSSFSPPPNPENAPYPSTFNEIVSLIQSGQPVPGIEDIDPTIAWGQGSKPSLKAKKKPWENDLSEEAIQPGARGGTFKDERDKFVVQELPDGDEPEFKGSNWWQMVEQRKGEGEQHKTEVGGNTNSSIS